MRLAILGETWDEDEAATGKVFTGSSGRVLRWFLANAGIDIKKTLCTVAFRVVSPNNKLDILFGKKETALPGLPAFAQGKYIRAEFADEVARVTAEIAEYKPTLILALGPVAMLIAANDPALRKIRGYPVWSPRWNCKVIGTYHPATVIRQWALNPIVFADLHKVTKELEFPELRRPNREIWIKPTLADLSVFERLYITPNKNTPLSVDIETQSGQITCIGFAPTEKVGLVLPFVDWAKPGNNYWPTLAEEFQAYKWAHRILSTAPRVLGQNFAYDFKYLNRYKIPVPGYSDDTMLKAHAQQPELEKGLNFLASVHTMEASWKFMRQDVKTIKQED